MPLPGHRNTGGLPGLDKASRWEGALGHTPAAFDGGGDGKTAPPARLAAAEASGVRRGMKWPPWAYGRPAAVCLDDGLADGLGMAGLCKPLVRQHPADALGNGSPPGQGSHGGKLDSHSDVVDKQQAFFGRAPTRLPAA
jgi:hypothetical protein